MTGSQDVEIIGHPISTSQSTIYVTEFISMQLKLIHILWVKLQYAFKQIYHMHELTTTILPLQCKCWVVTVGADVNNCIKIRYLLQNATLLVDIDFWVFVLVDIDF